MNLKQPKIRSKKHLKWISTLPCLVCGSRYVQAAHIRHGNGAGMGLKSGDDCTVPLCIDCHRKQHETSEAAFWGDVKRATQFANFLYENTGKTLEALQGIARFRNEIHR